MQERDKSNTYMKFERNLVTNALMRVSIRLYPQAGAILVTFMVKNQVTNDYAMMVCIRSGPWPYLVYGKQTKHLVCSV